MVNMASCGLGLGTILTTVGKTLFIISALRSKERRKDKLWASDTYRVESMVTHIHNH
jgi:hypothetical protein